MLEARFGCICVHFGAQNTRKLPSKFSNGRYLQRLKTTLGRNFSSSDSMIWGNSEGQTFSFTRIARGGLAGLGWLCSSPRADWIRVCKQIEFEFGRFETTRLMLLAHSLNPHNLKRSCWRGYPAPVTPHLKQFWKLETPQTLPDPSRFVSPAVILSVIITDMNEFTSAYSLWKPAKAGIILIVSDFLQNWQSPSKYATQKVFETHTVSWLSHLYHSIIEYN